MELKPGYKQTEVGVIPEEWKNSTVRGLASSARNAIVGGPFGSDLVSRDYVEHGVPVIRGQNMSGRWVSGNFVFVTPAKAKSLEANLAHPGDITFTQRGTLGQVSLVPDKPFDSYLVSQSQMKLSLNREVADPLFFFYVFTSEKQQELIRGGTIQTGVPHINLGILRDIPVQLPPLPEQRAIAGALGDMDALIGELDQLIAKKRDLKQAAMQQLLTGQTRLPGFSGEWELIPLVSLVKSEKFAIVDGPFGTQMKVEEYVSIGVPVIEMEHLNDGSINQRIKRCITPKKFEELKRSAVYPGDIVISKTGSLGYLGVIPDSLAKGIITSRLAKISLDASRADRSFIFQYLLKLRTDGYWEKVSQGGTMQILGIGMLQNAPIPNFSVPEQTAIAEVLADMDAELAALTQRRDKTHALKRGMMQELLTGRTRLV